MIQKKQPHKTTNRQQSGIAGLWPMSERNGAPLRILLTISLLWLLPTLACGSFAPRPTATPANQVGDAAQVQAPATQGEDASSLPAATPLPLLPTNTPAPEVTPTFTPTVIPGTALVAGQNARISAPGGLNLRDVPSTGGALVIQLGTNQVVSILDGPTDADGFIRLFGLPAKVSAAVNRKNKK